MKLFAVVAALILGAGAVCAQEDFYAGSNWEAPVPPEEFAPEAGGVEAPSPAPRTFLPTPVQPLPESSPLPAPTLP
ncbi:MAG TPA: hypothetical protein PK636_03965, partial [bacterium]|nr:hypothetical protein [bacterium]